MNLQKAIIEEFLPRFAPGSEVLYIGDAHKKSLLLDERKLEELGLPHLEHGILPDVIAHYTKKNWLLLIEAVHSSNPDPNCGTSSRKSSHPAAKHHEST